MSTITTILPTPPNGFSTQISTSSVSSSDLSIELDSTSGLGTEGVGQLLKKDADGNLVAGSVEFVHWTNVSGNTITFSDTDDRGITGSDSGAQSYVADDYFEVWVSSYYTPSGIREQINDTNGNEQVKFTATTSAVNEITVTNAATGNAPEISATGGDTNVDLKLKGKGTGHAQAYDNNSASYFDIVPNSSMTRQAIMNGNFDVWQRGTSSAVADDTALYLADRWREYAVKDGGTAPTLTASRQALTAGDIPGAFYHFRLATNGAGTSLGNSSYHYFMQRIEHGTRLLCGNGKKVTVSFWAKSDITNKKIGLLLIQDYGTGGSPSAVEVVNGAYWTLSSTWTQYTHTFTTNTLVGKTFGTANDDSLQPTFYLQYGSNFAARVGDSGAETYVGSGNIDIAQVQLCAGEVALPFQPKSYEEELRACLRYCKVITVGANYFAAGFGWANTTTTARIGIPLGVNMRTTPALTATAGDWQLADSANAGVDVTGIAMSTDPYSVPESMIWVLPSVASGLTQYRPYALRSDGVGVRTMIFDAEL